MFKLIRILKYPNRLLHEHISLTIQIYSSDHLQTIKINYHKALKNTGLIVALLHKS